MISDNSLPKEPAPDSIVRPGTAPATRRRRRTKVRSAAKYPRPVRFALWLGLPLLLWGGIYLVWRALS